MDAQNSLVYNEALYPILRCIANPATEDSGRKTRGASLDVREDDVLLPWRRFLSRGRQTCS